MIHTSLSPNAQADDVLLAASLIFRPWKWKSPNVVRVLEAALEEYIGVKEVLTVESGRTALYSILKGIGITAGDEVLMQAYTCVAVPEPVLWLGATPIYVDCTSDFTMDTTDLEKKITPKAKVLIIQHTFGKPADIDALLAIAKKHNLFVIEDCAHALGATYKENILGTWGDAAYWSFGRDKVISSVFGGALAVKDETIMDKVRAIVDEYPLPKNKWVLQQLLHPIILTYSKMLYNVFSIGKIKIEISKRLGFISKAVEKTELSGGVPSFAFHAFSPALAMLALNQFEKLSLFNTHRKEIAKLYDTKIAESGIRGIHTPQEDHNNIYLRYTLTCDKEEQVWAIMTSAKRAGMQFGDWYTSVLAPKGVAYKEVGYIADSCPHAEYLAKHTLNLPTHIGMPAKAVDKIIEIIKRSL